MTGQRPKDSGTPHDAGTLPDSGPPSDDMRDATEDLARSTRLGEYLRLCRDELLPAFDEEDRDSVRSQQRHRALVRWSAGTATAAMVLALAQGAAKTKLSPGALRNLLVLEGISILATAALVAVGLLTLRQTRWLLGRYRAERLRLVKFRFLVDPALWAGDALPGGEWLARFRAERDTIRRIDGRGLGGASQHEDVPLLAPPELCAAVPPPARGELVAYYSERRLRGQIAYFRRAAARGKTSALHHPRLVPLFFFFGIVGVLVHWAYKLSSQAPDRGLFGAAGAGVLAAAAALPAVWKGLRTYRGANELGRNASRSAAKQSALEQIAARLRGAEDPSILFGNLALCETVLAADQQEWLRLMLGAKWYG